MSDLISRADAIEAVNNPRLKKYDLDERGRLRIYFPLHHPSRVFVELSELYATIVGLPSADAVQGGDADIRNDRTYINEPYMQQSRHDDGRMTREEALEALKDLAEINIRYRCDDKWITALNMAIEALSADADSCDTCIYDYQQIPGFEDAMEKLDKLTLRGDDNE